MARLPEPQGWRQLHAMAQQERDPQKLAYLIDQMNSLLAQHEKMGENDDPSTSPWKDPDNLVKLDVHTWQYDA